MNPSSNGLSNKALSESQIIDIQSALARVEQDQRLLQSMAQMMLETWDARVDAIERAGQSKDPKGVAHSAHQLKGGLAIFGAAQAVNAAAAVEFAGREQNLAPLPEKMCALWGALSRLKPELEAIAAGQFPTSK